MIEKVTLQVVGDQKMHCTGCERTVTFTLSNLPGVKVVSADHKTQKIELIISSDETELEKVQSELDWIGYKVKSV